MKNPYGALPEVAERVTQVWLDKGTVLASLAAEADVLVTGMNEQRLAANIAEYHHIPLVALHFFPSRIQPSGELKSMLVKVSEIPATSGAGPAGGTRAYGGLAGDPGLRRALPPGTAG